MIPRSRPLPPPFDGRSTRRGDGSAIRRPIVTPVYHAVMTQNNAGLVDGTTVDGRYRITRHLADGGMASVYVARDLRLDRDVALKILRADLARQPEFATRFENEARAAARVSHPNIVAIQDQGNDGTSVFIVMELVRGRTLRDVLRAGGITVQAALDMFQGVLDGLAAAHAAGLAHGDIKPENVLVDESGTVKITDFGLARAATGAGQRSDMLLGTASYIAPEVMQSRSVPDARSDLYSAGLVLFELLTGRKAFDGMPALSVAFRHVTEPVPTLEPSSGSGEDGADVANADSVHARCLPDAVVRAFEPVIASACAKDPLERPSSAAEMLSSVVGARGHVPENLLSTVAIPVRAPHGPEARVDHTEAIGASTHTQLLAHGSSVTPGKKKRNVRPVSAAIVAALALTAIGIGAFRSWPENHHQVPTVKGLARAAAEQRLKDSGFSAKVVERTGQQAAGTVIDSEPRSGTDAEEGSGVTLYVSKSAQDLVVPRVIGLSEADARARLEHAGFRVGTTAAVSSSAPSGSVVGSRPSTGAKAPTSQPVTLQVSDGTTTGSNRVTVPSVVGMTGDTARIYLSSFGLMAVLPDGGKNVAVTTQAPAAGTSVPLGTTIQLD